MSTAMVKKVAFVSTFPPKRCGIATFTSDLITNTALAGGDRFEPLVFAMQSDDECNYSNPVKFEIRSKVKNDYISAANYINFSSVDIVSIQHEFGMFGGEAGSYLNLLLSRVHAPIVTTLHTVLQAPDEHYYQSTVDVCKASHKVIVMNERGVEMLRDIYGISPDKVELVPHGIPDLPFVDSSYYKHKFGMEDRKTILTFGLLSKNKGVELMLKALPSIINEDPSVLYIILGATHPGVIAYEGEEYRNSLQQMVRELGIQDNVIFYNQYVNDEKLHNFLCAADIYVTPYVNREQLTSGTLAFAVGTGKAVVSTPYWAAEELLSEDRGKLVDFNNSDQLAETIIELVKNDSLFYALRQRAYEYGRNITWPTVGKTYWKLFTSKGIPVPAPPKSSPIIEDSLSILALPEPPLDHLIRMTDDTGLYQHGKYIVPNRTHGYCTDDNTRALVAMTQYYSQYGEKRALELFDTYLSFVYHSQNEDGTVKNFMDFDRQWFKSEPAHDALGRALWAWGAVMSKPPLPNYMPMIKECFDKSVKHVPDISIRGKAYSIFGMADYLKQFPGASDIKRYLATASKQIAIKYESNSSSNWQWFEDSITYDNAVLPHAMFAAAEMTGNARYLEIAINTCRFLLENTFNGNHFSFIGCNGWLKRNGDKAKFDQQPLEVACTTMMLRAAFDATGDISYLKLQRKAFDWFFGENDLHIPVYDFRTKGCGDGLEQSGVNQNQGAESLVSFLLSLLSVVEGYGTKSSVESESNVSTQGNGSPVSDHTAIVDHDGAGDIERNLEKSS